MPKIPFMAEDKLASSGKPRSPSPPIRRSISTDRGAHIRSRVKADATDNQPIAKIPFPARVPVNKSLATMPVILPSTDHNSRVQISAQDQTRQESISDTLYSLQKVMMTTKKVHQEHEEEQFKQALNIRQGGIRKSKPENKAKAKQHQIIPARLQKSDVVTTLLSDLEVGSEKVEEPPRKSDFSEPENEHVPLGSPVHASLKAKKIRQNFSRNSQNLEPRYVTRKLQS